MSMVLWNGLNLASEAVCRRQGRDISELIRYEDFLANPVGVLKQILSLAQERRAATPFIDDHAVRLGRHHTVSGNPSRFETGVVELRKDERWLDEMSGRTRLLTTILGLPLLVKYGYRLRDALPRELLGERHPSET
jgi:hypothetical protein